MPTIRGARFRLSQAMKKFAERVYTVPGGEIYDIGQDRLGPNAKRALVVYTIQAIPYLLAGDVQKCPIINEHTMYWESAEMVRLLNEHGYVVDYYDIHSRTPINWSKYQLVIDERNNLVHAPNAADLTKIFYCTGNHWLFQNTAELGRIKDFHRRHGVFVAPERQFPAVFTDEVADYMTYFGTPFQLQLFHPASRKHQLNISAVFTPPAQPKNVAQAKRNFLWLGSGGLLLKGLDLAVEAFSQMPDLHLYIAGNAEREPRLWSWLKPMFDKYPNLHYLGWMDVASREFSDVANKCIGTVYVSSTEGGPGSIAQLVHFGLIPIATETSAVRTAEALGHVIRSQEPAVIIDELKERVQALVALPDAELLAQSEQVREFAAQNHTREAYSHSFQGLLERVAESR